MAVATAVFGFGLLATVNVDHEGEIAYVLSAIASESARTTKPSIFVEPPNTVVNCSDCWCTAKGTERSTCLNLTSESCTAGTSDFQFTFRDPNCK